jgi:hypothetical protein
VGCGDRLNLFNFCDRVFRAMDSLGGFVADLISHNAVCGPRRPDPGSVRVALHTSARIRRAADQRDGYAATWIREFQETDCRCFGMGRASFLRVAPESDETRSETSLKTSWVRKPKHPAVPPQFHDFYSCACGPTAHAC